ncbi:MAG: cytidylate kinase-like family protein [Lachnospiraceae bacterium]|nr:cytidylate kinase-like family protein [Lachnospiraceae bacterium]
MGKQVVITISRECGSGGRMIATLISEQLGIEMYDRNMDEAIADEMGLDLDELERFEGSSRNRIVSRKVMGYSNSIEDILVEKQEEWLHSKADLGASFLVIGRMAENMLKDHPGLIKIFITGDEDFKVRRIMDVLSVNEREAKERISKVDHVRRSYHNHYAHHKWGDSRYYDLVINSSKLGLEATAGELVHYIQARIDALEE